MHPDTLAQFFLWCAVINTGMLLLWTLFLLATPGWIYSTQKPFFPMEKDQFRLVFYCLIGFFKVMVIIFNWVPYFALKIIA